MAGPIVSFICWNRAGLNARNLLALLETTDDFELHIVDSNSVDDTWDFLMTLKDPRIKEIKKMDTNRGCTYNLNYVMAQRRKDQYFCHMDSDLHMLSKDWVTQFMRVMETYEKIGMICAVHEYYLNVPSWKNRFTHHEKNGIIFEEAPFCSGCCFCMSPGVIEQVGYFNEETCGCDADINARIKDYTDYKMGVVPTIKVAHTQRFGCEQCPIRAMCTVEKQGLNCFDIHDSKYRSKEFADAYPTRYLDFTKAIQEGKRTAYCASMHDQESLKNHYYDKKIADENIQFFIDHTNS